MDSGQTKPMLRVSNSEHKSLVEPKLEPKRQLESKRQPEQQPVTKELKTDAETKVRPAVAAAAAKPPTPTRTARLEIEEESEDRRQITRNGRLVFDDRLNERRYETHRSTASSPMPMPMTKRQQDRERSVASPSSALSTPLASPGGILRNAHVHSPVQRQLLKPISLRASQNQQQHQLADQISNLSSDPETMDSGIAPSGAGSSNALNQRPGQSGRPAGSAQFDRQTDEYQSRPHLNEPASLTFVDDDDEDDDEEMNEFVDQLGREKGE